MNIVPLVNPEDREAYEQHALQNQWWIAEGHMYNKEVAEDLYIENRYYDQPKFESPFPIPRWNESNIFPLIWDFGERRPEPAAYDAPF